MRKTILAATGLALSGCFVQPREPEPPGTPPPVCVGEADCRAKWEAAQLFVVKHSDQKIQVATDVLIETYNPTYSTNIAMRVTKEPLGGGRYQLIARAFCANPFGCNQRPRELVIQFNYDIAEVVP